jgi:hypothetical protein|tara:strand:+ start:258 stop:482 length:225 start_codon:yes stop_codon:yes gene_type:complete
MIEMVVVLAMYIIENDERKLDGWYHQPSLSVCLEGKRVAERTAGNQVAYTCSLEKGIMVTDKLGVKHLDKIIND